MPFFQESMENEDIDPTREAEADTTSRPLAIHGMDQMRRRGQRHRQTSVDLLRPRPSEESIRTEFCEGLLQEHPKSTSPEPELCPTTTSDRAELIERLKRGESPTWVPNRLVCCDSPQILNFKRVCSTKHFIVVRVFCSSKGITRPLTYPPAKIERTARITYCFAQQSEK